MPAAYFDEENNLAGPYGQLWLILSQRLNFTFDIITTKELVYGSPLANGSFSGFVGMVQRDDLDMTVGDFRFVFSGQEDQFVFE